MATIHVVVEWNDDGIQSFGPAYAFEDAALFDAKRRIAQRTTNIGSGWREVPEGGAFTNGIETIGTQALQLWADRIPTPTEATMRQRSVQQWDALCAFIYGRMKTAKGERFDFWAALYPIAFLGYLSAPKEATP